MTDKIISDCEKKNCHGIKQLVSVDSKFVLFVCSDCNRPYVYRRIVK